MRRAAPQPLTQAELAGKAFLRTWFYNGVGRQAETSRRSGLSPSHLSKLANRPDHPIGFEQAVMLEVATDGQVPAHILCPLRAEALAKLLALRNGGK